ncbi:MAG TPA: pyrroline-5-carboxylate reductase [Candidatus Binatia bacterium]|nr:pyrroline-5-carboxylate reductase [Candidatus Binatia bacterium]
MTPSDRATPELIAFVGGGQMGAALAGGLIAAGHAAARLRVAEPDAARAAALARQLGVDVRARAADVVAGAAAVVLAVKPQSMREALAGLRVAESAVVISIAAGVRTATLRELLGGHARIVRAMPNTPALLRAGITGLHAAPGLDAAARALAERVLGAVGATCWVPEEAQLDAVTALSGSGPAYYFLLTEVLRDAGVALGLDRATASALAEKTFTGAARMAGDGKDVAELRANVTSKGGTTEAAVAELERNGVRELFKNALQAAAHRSAELGDALSRAPSPESRAP